MEKRELQFEGRIRLRHGINLVPLINIVFLLLIFFMVSSTLVTPDKFEIELPESDQGETHENMPIVISINSNGEIAVNNVPMGYNDLTEALEVKIDSGEDKNVIVRADASASTSDIVAVLRHAKNAGIERIAIATQPGTSP